MILIASALPETRNYFMELLEPSGLVLTVSDYYTANTALAKLRPRLLFLDIDLLDVDSFAQMASLCARYPQAKFIVLGSYIPPQRQIDLYVAGVHGCCEKTIKAPQMKLLLDVVQNGEIWISRTQVGHLLRRMNSASQEGPTKGEQSVPCLSGLTPREKEIAILVSNGKNNRQISEALQISETTVKSHLSTVFRKLGINDRLSLALQVNSLIQSASPAFILSLPSQTELLHSA